MRKQKRLSFFGIYTIAALFFAFSSFFGLYSRKIYDYNYFVFFFVLEILFGLGLKSGKLVIGKHYKRCQYRFKVTQSGKRILLILNILSILSFIYFLIIYNRSIGLSLAGAFTASAFEDEGRTTLEKVTLLIMQMGGDASFLVLSSDKEFGNKKHKLLASICLFLPGIRYLLMGARYAIAVEALMYLVIKREEIQKMAKKKVASFQAKLWITILMVALFVVFMYLFATRSVYYTALQKFEFYPGDMELKPFWKKLYNLTEGKIDFLCSFSDYMAEAPYVFSYYCKYGMPKKSFGGILFFRPLFKIVSALFGGNVYDSITSSMMSGKYSGCFYSIICDFGLYFSPIAVYLYGFLFSKIERNSSVNKVCCALCPAIAVICFFAPVYYFTVGRLDFTMFFTVILALTCLRRVKYER